MNKGIVTGHKLISDEFIKETLKHLKSEYKYRNMKNMKNMKKSDLRSGMIIKNRKGEFAKVLLGTTEVLTGDGDTKQSRKTWGNFDEYADDLRKNKYGSHQYDNDIVAIYDMESNMTGASISIKGPLLWERTEDVPPVPEYTMEELQEKLGEFKLIK